MKVVWIGTLALSTAIMAACTPAAVKQGSYATANDGLTRAEISISAAARDLQFSVLPADANNVFEADLNYIGEIDFNVTGEDPRYIRLSEEVANNQQVGSPLPVWDLRLRPDIALAVELSLAAANTSGDLSGLNIEQLDIAMSAGDTDLTLPAQASSGSLGMSAGDLTLRLQPQSDLSLRSIAVSSGDFSILAEPGAGFSFDDLTLSSGDISIDLADSRSFTGRVSIEAGTLTLSVPEGVGLRLDAQSVAAGDISVPIGYDAARTQLESAAGLYTSPGYDSASVQIQLTVTIAAGDLIIR